MRKSILFVQDGPGALESLHRLLAPMEREWDMAFLPGLEPALESLAARSFDAVVTDLRLGAGRGKRVLEAARDRHPGAVRVALSGPGDQDLLVECLGTAHQALPRAFGLEELIVLLANATRLGSPGVDPELRQAIGSLEHLPSLPQLYQRLRDALEHEDATVKTVGDIILQDVGMSAKLLNLVNSAFFGLRRNVDSIQEAVAFLGTETLKVLVLAYGLFDQTGPLGTQRVGLEDIWQHSLSVAKGARALASMEGLDRARKAEAFMGGMLHDVGILVLAQNFPSRYDRVVHTCEKHAIPVYEAEREEFGLAHPEAGALLLGLWGIQSSVIKAVCLHHSPSSLRAASFNPILAIHLADDLCGAKGHHPLFERGKLDERALSSLGIRDHMAGWLRVLAEATW